MRSRSCKFLHRLSLSRPTNCLKEHKMEEEEVLQQTIHLVTRCVNVGLEVLYPFSLSNWTSLPLFTRRQRGRLSSVTSSSSSFTPFDSPQPQQTTLYTSANYSCRPDDETPTAALVPLSTSSSEIAEEELPDDVVLKAIVSSMQQYYQRRNQAKEKIQKNSLVRRKRDEEVVCYDDLGCFRDEGPFDYLDTLPQQPERIGTKFLLFTSANPDTAVTLHYDNVSSMYNPLFNRSQPIKLMVHGFGSSCQKQWAIEMRKALLQLENVNVICVNWEEGAALPNYVQAAANTRVVGKQVAKFIRTLNQIRGTNNTFYHLIGFSLGAHVAGFAGDEVKNLSRITGLDPAAPLYEGYSLKARLDPSDANFVDVIHSNGESLLYGGLGAFEPMGHVDYYPNGGKVQGGCSNIFLGAISDLIWHQSRKSDGGQSLCNHRRAYKFFADSIMQSCHFPAFSCKNYESFMQGECFDCKSHGKCGKMGYYADQSAGSGKFYLLTRDTEPFCSNQFKVAIESSSGSTPTYGSLELTLINRNLLNETFQITSNSEQLMPGRPLTTVIVAHPLMNNLISAQIKYTPYKGWMTSGLERWAVDKITVTHSSGQKYSFCRRGLPLTDGKPTTVYLSHKQCDDNIIPPIRRKLKRKPVLLKPMDMDSEINMIPHFNYNYTKYRYPIQSKIIYGKKVMSMSNGDLSFSPRLGYERGGRQQQMMHSDDQHRRRSVRLIKWIPEARAQIVYVSRRMPVNDMFIPARVSTSASAESSRRFDLYRHQLPITRKML
ncbi:hypothetical protein CHUAL_011945 [Chamberlinius hualienensis]